MEGLLISLVGAFLLWLLIGPIVALVRANLALRTVRESDASELRRRIETLERRIADAESPLRRAKLVEEPPATRAEVRPAEAIPVHAPVPGAEDADAAERALHHEPTAAAFEVHEAQLSQSDTDLPPVAPPFATPLAQAIPQSVSPHGQDARATKDAPPPLPAFSTIESEPEPEPKKSPPPPAPSPVLPTPAFNWEQFMGAKLFAWLGGLALFLGVAFSIKWSFDHGWISPSMRAAAGFITGTGLIIGGLCLNRDKYAVTQQTLAGTGTLVLYAVTFACNSIWKFDIFAQTHGLLAFGLMAGITATAFLIAVRLDARVVAVLGIAGGFLTPVLLSTGKDNPFGLFGYIAVLNCGLLAVALRKRWHFLAALGAAGTTIMQFGWWGKFYRGSYDYATGAHIPGYPDSQKIYIPMGIFLGLAALFAGAAWVAKRREQTSTWFSGAGLVVAGYALLCAIPFLDAPFLRDTPALPFAYAFAAEALVFLLAACDKRIRLAGPIAGGVLFLMLGGWTADRLSETNLNTALALYLAFALVHTAVPLTLKRLGKILETPRWCHVFPILALLLALIPAFKYDSLLVWPLLLLVDVLAVVIAVAGAILWPLLFVLGLTVLAALGAFLHVGHDLTGLNEWLLILGGVSVAFIALGVWLWKKFAPKPDDESGLSLNNTGNAAIATVIPPVSAILPFLLLIMAAAKLPLADPSSVFGLALLLSVLLLGLAKLLRIGVLAPVGLAGTALLEFAWAAHNFRPEANNEPLALGWTLGFAALYFAYPFVFHDAWKNKVAPWIASVASLGLHFLLFHSIVITGPHDYPGLHPLAFALPAFAGLALVLKRTPQESPARLSQLALFGGAALAFITAIFPLQFERQWLTLAWAFEGAALLWLFRRVPHKGLHIAGLALLAATFARLAINPAVLSYHARGDMPVFNWYLYTYGLAAAALAIAARLLPENSERVAGILRAGSAVLGFLLLNIEIADFFSVPGTSVLTFDFSGNFARDMSYSIGWGLFALGMLITGIVKRERAPRYAAIALLAITLGKLFFHDLANLDQLYRIGAFFGVAVIAIAASFLYQKFLAEEKK